MLFFLLGCAAHKKPFYNKDFKNWESYTPKEQQTLIHSTFLIGDAGEPSIEIQEPALKLLQQQLYEAAEQSSLVFLGDNIYQHGLPDSSLTEERKAAETKIIAQLKILKEYKGRVFFIPGNHDWAKSKPEGRQNILNQEQFIENYLNRSENVFVPDAACPTPQEIILNDDLVLICIDTQWWLHPHHQAQETADCDAKTEADFIFQLNDLLQKHKYKKIIVAGHHPLYSNGVHGGHFPLIEHLFPFERKKIYVPMPLLGSIYVGYRKFIGDRQDIPNERYQKLKNVLTTIFKKHPNLVYVCGHDHSLQYHQKDSIHYLISGAGSKESHVARKQKAAFAYSKKGFAKLNFYENGETWVEFWTPEGDGSSGKIVFKYLLFTQKNKTLSTDKTQLEYTGKTISKALGNYQAEGIKEFLWGKNYRKEWTTPVDFPYFDIDTEKGGLQILKRGGGQATNSLRLEAKDGRQYVLRSVDKQGDKALSEDFKGTFVSEIVQDQTSSAYPYGALVVPTLAEAVGIYHTNPKYVYLPKDDRLGGYKEGFGDAVYLFEERPDDGLWKEADFFGNPDQVINTSKVIKRLTKDNDNLVKQKFVLRNRLFDILIGDWDRHDDQWSWVASENKKENLTFYTPIPRDRDQVFFDSDGFLTGLGSQKWALPKFQGFKAKIKNVEGLNFNNRHFDRYFLTEPSLEDWLAVADTLQKHITDEVITQALAVVPPEVAKYSIEDIKAKLIQRRNDLKTYARAYYLFLSKNVNVLGSDKHERFEIERLNEEETRVSVYKIKKNNAKPQHLIYQRIFKKSETKEIRLYGLEGEDEFILTGEVKKGIKVRIIGGKDPDQITDNSWVKKGGKKTIVYDLLKNTELKEGKETKNRLSIHRYINDYHRDEFKYNYFGPSFFGGFNPDDGVFLGGGVNVRRQGFRKSPFASKQIIKGNYALATQSFNFVYLGEFTDIWGKLDLVLDAEVRSPNYVQNFFGLGNETQNLRREKGVNYHRVRYTQWYFEPQLRLDSEDKKHRLNLGAYFQSIEVEENPNRFITNFDENGLNPENTIEDHKYFLGLQARYQYDSRDNALQPRNGVILKLKAARVSGLNDEDLEEINYTKLSGDFSFYKKLFSNWVFANRIGAAANWGNYQFYQANTLGANENLRGYRNYRFSGDKIFYNNTDLRIQIGKIQTFLFNGSFGMIASHDIGRVWFRGEDSQKWHRSYGGGLWLSPANALLISTTFNRSEEDNVFFLRFGFLF